MFSIYEHLISGIVTAEIPSGSLCIILESKVLQKFHLQMLVLGYQKQFRTLNRKQKCQISRNNKSVSLTPLARSPSVCVCGAGQFLQYYIYILYVDIYIIL